MARQRRSVQLQFANVSTLLAQRQSTQSDLQLLEQLGEAVDEAIPASVPVSTIKVPSSNDDPMATLEAMAANAEEIDL